MALLWKPVQLTNPMVEPFSVGSQIESSGIMLSDLYTWGAGGRMCYRKCSKNF